uniref:RNA polymerase II-associated protein 3 n=1 Tax=Schistosoma mansoni TaxID=6183 RepID=A0A5K4F468_SCHMA
MKLALIYFNRCIELCLKYNLNEDKRLAVIYRNRSLIYLQLNEYQLACNDCTSALSIESNCPIALYRRSLALKFLGDHSGCLKDLQKAYSLSPNNNRIIEELKKMQNTVVHTDKMNTDVLTNKSQTVITTSIISSTSDLEIIDLPNVDSEKEDNIHDDNVNDDDNNNSEILEEEAEEEENDESYDKLSSMQCNSMNPSCHISTDPNDFSKFQPNSTNVMTKSIDNEWEEVNLINKEDTKIANTSSINSTIENSWKLDKPITNSYEFQNYWINIQHLKRLNYINAMNEIIILLHNILPEQLPKLIGIRMEAEMLDDLLNAINVSMNTENNNSLWIYDILIQLSKTARFDCALFLISDDTKQGRCSFSTLCIK